MLPKDFYDKVEEPGYLKHILYGDSVSKNTKTIVRFKNSSSLEYLTFDEIWNKLVSNKIVSPKEDKEYISIEDELETVTYDIKNDTWYTIKPKYIIRHKINTDIVKLNFTNLTYLDVTKNHSMLDYDPVKRILKIKSPQDMIYVPAIISSFSFQKNEINQDYLLLGIWFGDGTLTKSKPYSYQYPAISSNNQPLLVNYLKQNIPNLKTYEKNEWDFCVNYKWLRNKLINLKMEGIKSINRFLSDNLMEELKQDYIKLVSFFIGYWIADGSFNNGQFVIASANQKILEQFQYLLMIIGIYSHLKIDKNNRKYQNQINGDMYKLSTSLNDSMSKLLQNYEFLKDNPKSIEFKTLYYGSCSGNRKRTETDFQVCRKLKYAHLFGIKPVKITSKELIKYDDYVYDFSIPETQNFVANGFLVHNTDSLFVVVPTKDADKLTTEEKLKVSDKASEDINNAIIKYLTEYFLPKSNISPDSNMTFFKSEMLMEAIMFLDVKKNYAYKMLAKKGKIFKEPKMKYTGIQVVKSDTSKITQEMLKDMIEGVVLNHEILDKDKLPRLSQIVNEYHEKFLQCCNNLDLNYISFPGKWQKKLQFVNGMQMYNYMMKKEIFSLGSAATFIYCTFKAPKLFTNFDMTKINGICVPYVYDKDMLKQKLNDFQIEIDRQTQWDRIFSTTCGRIVELIKSQRT